MKAIARYGLALASLTIACSSDHRAEPTTGDGGTEDVFASPPRCTSGTTRDPNESEGPEMMPGHACIACHDSTVAATGEDAPVFAFGGTAFPSAHEPDDCVGSGAMGAHITVLDAAGKRLTATANTSGNFFVEDQALTFPITAMLELGGRKREMTAPQMSGDCNSCHTQAGAEGAPGRITLP